MSSFETIGRWLVILGIVIVLIGGLIWLFGRLPGTQNLPGTIKIEWGGLTCVIPLLASILISIILTVVLNLIARGGNR